MSVAVRAGMNNSIDESIVWPRNVWRQFGMLRHMAHFAGCQQARQDTKEALQPALVGAFDATCDRGTVDESSNNLPSLNVCTATPAALLYLGALAEWHAENDPTWNANNGIRLPADVRSVLDRRPDPVARFDALFFETCLQRPGLLAELVRLRARARTLSLSLSFSQTLYRPVR